MLPTDRSRPRTATLTHGGVTEARVASADILADLRGGDLLDAAFERRAGGLDARDRRWTQELVYGTLRRRAILDALLTERVRGGLARLDADLTDILRLGVYQLLQMRSVPPYAAIAQSVELAKRRHGIGASKLANAVLRRVDRERGDESATTPKVPADPVAALALATSHPQWLVQRWVERWGLLEARTLLERNNIEAPMVIRPFGIVREQLETMLESSGVAVEDAPLVGDGLALTGHAALAEVGAFRQGLFFVQDPAATLVTRYAAFPAGETVVDLCAAPGGKAFELSRTAKQVIAADRSPARLARMQQSIDRLDVRNVSLVATDARDLALTQCRGGTGRCPVHGDGDVPSSSGRALAPPRLRPRGERRGAARDPALGGGARCTWRPAGLQHLFPRARGERAAGRGLPRRARRLLPRAATGGSGAGGRPRRRDAARPPPTGRRGRRLRRAPAPEGGVKRPSARVRTVLQYLAVAASGFLAAYLLVAFVILPDDVALGDVTVPGVINLTQGDAQRRLTALGLTVSIGESRYSPDAPKSTVLSQNPAAGTIVSPGSAVTLDVSAGQQRATIPSLLGLSRADAERALDKAGLAMGQVREEASDSARGLVLDARPSEGQVVPLGTRVDLAVSSGPAELTMPDVVGRDFDGARTLIAQLGLAIAPAEYDPNSTLPAGTVVAQTPAAGSPVPAGTSVALRVAGNP